MNGVRPASIWSLWANDDTVGDYVASRVANDRPVRFAIAGGHTPRPILANLAKRDLAWHNLTIYPTDERMVSVHGRASNFRMIQDAMHSCSARIAQLDLGFSPPKFDLVWLGMGLDGKIASLFNYNDCIDGGVPAVKSVCPKPLPRTAPYNRLSLNRSALTNAAEAILVIRGGLKLRLARQAFSGRTELPLGALVASTPHLPWRIFWMGE